MSSRPISFDLTSCAPAPTSSINQQAVFATSRAVRDELVDVVLYLVRLCSVLGVDLNEAVTHKIQANGRKYPAGDSTPYL
nr:MazG-like family protein [Pusillimonas noertemannii]